MIMDRVECSKATHDYLVSMELRLGRGFGRGSLSRVWVYDLGNADPTS